MHARVLLGLLLMLGLGSCRVATVAEYRVKGWPFQKFHGQGFDYTVYAHTRNNSPGWQTVQLSITSRSSRDLELRNLSVRVRWQQGERTHTVVPYHTFEISPAAKLATNPRLGAFLYVDKVTKDRTTFDLKRLSAVVPAPLRMVAPRARRSYALRFSQSATRCIPKSISRILVEVGFEVRVGEETKRYSRTIVLKPHRKRQVEYYNSKSRAWTYPCCK